MRTDPPPLMPIFRSQSQGRILAELLPDPGRELTVSELARLLGAPKQTVQQEVDRLVAAAILRDRRQGRNRLIRANDDHRNYAVLAQLALDSFGPHRVIAEEFAAVPGADEVIIFGSWAARYRGEPGPPPRDIDVLVIGDASKLVLYDAAARAEKRLGIEVNPQLVSHALWDDPTGWALIEEIKRRPYVDVETAASAG